MSQRILISYRYRYSLNSCSWHSVEGKKREVKKEGMEGEREEGREGSRK